MKNLNLKNKKWLLVFISLSIILMAASTASVLFTDETNNRIGLSDSNSVDVSWLNPTRTNGVTKGVDGVKLGQDVNQVGAPATLSASREIPLGGNNVLFSGNGGISVGANFTTSDRLYSFGSTTGFQSWRTQNNGGPVQYQFSAQGAQSGYIRMYGASDANYPSTFDMVSTGGISFKPNFTNGKFVVFSQNLVDSTLTVKAGRTRVGRLPNGVAMADDFTVAGTSRFIDALAALAGIDLNNQRITSVGTPVDPLDGTNKAYVDAAISTVGTETKVIVTQASQLAGTLDPTKVYEVHGTVDMGSTPIEVPATGLTIRGLGVNSSKLISSQTGFILFTSPVGGSGDLNMTDISIEVTGTGGQVYLIDDVDGTHAFEIEGVNYNGCTSLGSIEGYRQGRESDMGRFGGTPTLELIGNWAGGFRASESIVRGVSSATVIFKAGAGLVLNSRFKTDINVVLPVGAVVCDFSPANINSDGDFQINGGDFSGLTDRTLYFPNMPVSSTRAFYRDNSGIENTFIGAVWECSTETATTVSGGLYSQVLGTITPSDTIHFTADSPNEITYLSSITRDIAVQGNITVTGGAGDVVRLLIRHWDDSAGAYVDGRSQSKSITNLVGTDQADFFLYDTFRLDINDRIEIWGRNETDDTSFTMSAGSILTVKAR